MSLTIEQKRSIIARSMDTIDDIYEIYDRIFFNGQISRKLGDSKIIVKFANLNNLSSSSYIGNIYYIYLNKFLHNTNKIDLLYIFEDELVNVLMMLYGFGNREDLHLCALKKLFNHKRVGVPRGIFMWHENSCYLDTLLVLFMCDAKYWRYNLLVKDISKITYGNPSGICGIGSQIDTIPRIRKLAKSIRNILISDYKDLNKGISKKCTNLRDTLHVCLPDMKEHNIYVPYNISAIYDILSELFSMKIRYTVQIYNHSKKEYSKPRVDKVSMFTVWEYMEHIDLSSDQKIIRWDTINHDVLVFTNGGIPNIRNLDETGIEYINGVAVRKDRCMGYVILNKYKLVGVAVLSRGHYIGYFLSHIGLWYHYDDVRGYTVIDSLSHDAWKTTDTSIPSLYLYAKMNTD